VIISCGWCIKPLPAKAGRFFKTTESLSFRLKSMPHRKPAKHLWAEFSLVVQCMPLSSSLSPCQPGQQSSNAPKDFFSSAVSEDAETPGGLAENYGRSHIAKPCSAPAPEDMKHADEYNLGQILSPVIS